MKRTEEVYREMLFQAEKENIALTQKEISEKLALSLSNINKAIAPLRRMGAIEVKRMGLNIINARKIIYYWASSRNLAKDIVYSTRVEKNVKDIEKRMPDTAVFTAYSAYALKYREAPADYSEVYVYCDDLDEIKKRFPSNRNRPNLFVLKKDRSIDKYGKIATTANIFVDLWNLGEWYAAEFIKELEKKWNIGTQK